jgi:hypothetical protein
VHIGEHPAQVLGIAEHAIGEVTRIGPTGELNLLGLLGVFPMRGSWVRISTVGAD